MNELAYKILTSGFKPGATDAAIAAHVPVNNDAWTAITKEQIARCANDFSVEGRIWVLEQALLRRAEMLDKYEARMLQMITDAARLNPFGPGR